MYFLQCVFYLIMTFLDCCVVRCARCTLTVDVKCVTHVYVMCCTFSVIFFYGGYRDICECDLTTSSSFCYTAFNNLQKIVH